MSESFAALFEESLKRAEMRSGEVITAEVVRVEHNHVVVNAGLKSEAYVPIEEFKNDQGELEVQAGDFVSVAISSAENGFGETILSRDTAKRLASWLSLEKARLDCTGQWHPRLLAWFAGRHTSYQRPDSLRKQNHGVQGHQARPQAQQRCALTPRCNGSQHGRRTRQTARNPQRRLYR